MQKFLFSLLALLFLALVYCSSATAATSRAFSGRRAFADKSVEMFQAKKFELDDDEKTLIRIAQVLQRLDWRYKPNTSAMRGSINEIARAKKRIASIQGALRRTSSTDDVNYLKRKLFSAQNAYDDAYYTLRSSVSKSLNHFFENVGEDYFYIAYAARLGDSCARYLLGLCLFFGDTGIYVDKKSAVTLFKLAAEGGYQEAYPILGECYLTGEGVSQNVSEGLKWLNKSLDNADTSGCVALADHYARGDYLPKNISKAVGLYKKAASKGDVYANRRLGYIYYYEDRDIPSAIPYLIFAANKNDLPAQSLLGEAYVMIGENAKAVPYLSSAANKGDENSQFFLGLFYEKGIQFVQNDAKAVEFYKKSADAGHPIAPFQLGLMYGRGAGVPQDLSAAKLWIERAVERKSSLALEWYEKNRHLPVEKWNFVSDL